ncbi:MAG: hypothetical protein OZSIB_3803 [Candidatus Ozemobacter sibiricus]|uniref:Uncharacterized protein n=1 Tax=Candidatus Ozemobacter sibiricus TaxID=2268124 RepID=A0A367ZP68_9BACT|nr:MAG: hypothetical protein OZSIB_3803 [Candidatus Ozemobacter sibiricus]
MVEKGFPDGFLNLSFEVSRTGGWDWFFSDVTHPRQPLS